MSELPDDVWACAYLLQRVKDGHLSNYFATFLVRGRNRDEAYDRLRAIATHDAQRLEATSVMWFMNDNPGERAMGTISNQPLAQNKINMVEHGPLTADGLQYSDPDKETP